MKHPSMIGLLLATLFLSSCSAVTLLKAPTGLSDALLPAQVRLPMTGQITGPAVTNGQKTKDIRLLVQYQVPSGFQTKALDCTKFRYFKAWIRGIGMPTTLYPAGVDADLMTEAGRTCNFAAIVPNVPFGAVRLAFVTAYDRDKVEIPGSTLSSVFKIDASPTSTVLNELSMAATEVVDKILQQSDAYEADLMATRLSIDKLKLFLSQIAQLTGHANHINTAQVASDLIGQNGNLDALSSSNVAYQIPSATFNGNISGLGGGETVTIQITDSASKIKINLGNGAFAITSLKPGTWKIKMFSNKYILQNLPAPITLATGQSSAVIPLAVVPAVTEKWSVATGGTVTSSPAVSADGTSVYVGSADGKLYGLVAATGTAKTGFPVTIGGSITGSPVLSADGSTVYVGSSNNQLHAINTADGSARAGFPVNAGGALTGSPALTNDGATVYIGAGDSNLYAYDTTNGAAKAGFPVALTGAVGTSPLIGAGGVVYVSTQTAGKLHAINPDGSAKWAVPFDLNADGITVPTNTAMAANGRMFLGGQVCGGCGNKLLSITDSGANGTKNWAIGGPNISSPTIGPNGWLYYGNGNGNNTVQAVDSNTGGGKGQYALGGTVSTSPAVGADGLLYFGSDDNHVYALDQDLNFKWKFPTGGAVQSSPGIGPDGTIYVGSNDNKIYALTTGVSVGDVAIQGLAATQWPHFNGNGRNTGSL